MATLSKEIQDAVIAKCQSQAADIASSLTQALGQQFESSVTVEPQMLGELIANYPDPGLVVLSTVGSAGLVMAIPNREQILPAWCAAPDKAGESRLATLGQELGMLLLPDDVIAEDSRQAWVPHVGQALARGNCVDEAALLLQVKFDGQRVLQLIMAWPAQNPAAILSPPAPVAPKQPAPAKAASSAPAQAKPPVPPPVARRRRQASMQDLPSYSRSLLKIKVPVIVTLASKRQPLGRIVELGPGSIIHFNKSCEEMLDLEVGGQAIAQGEPIKVGDKFGIRLTSLVMPNERFLPLANPAR
jgi:flagellar motor switch/type III secretory pathway protein FliN